LKLEVYHISNRANSYSTLAMNRKKIKYAEIALISLVWIVLLVIPVLFREESDNSLWKSINNQLEILIPVSLLFLLNRFVFVPFFLFKGKLAIFIVLLSGMLVLLALGSYYYDTRINLPPGNTTQSREQQNPPPRPPRDLESRPERPSQPERPPQTETQPQPGKRQPRPVPPFANFLVLSVLLVGFDTGLRSGLRWIETENEKVQLEKQNVATQLVLLQNQISPHFFMNTLNNIHSLVDKNSAEAKEAIIKLSKMMRYLLYETGTEKTTLKKEVEFLESYINLMKLRYSAKVKISLSLPVSIPEKTIPPFLFLSLIENAFKHGISFKAESFVDIDFNIGENRLLLVVKNSKTDKNTLKEFSGIGIENTRKRLALLFGNDYHLDIIDGEDLFTVNLSIPI
jgi:CRISPR/Cas system CSM-associated protein Csm2 small subunit